jgi:hypothetical protein
MDESTKKLFRELWEQIWKQIKDNKKGKIYGKIRGEDAFQLFGIEDMIPMIECCCHRLEKSAYYHSLAERIMKCIEEWQNKSHERIMKRIKEWQNKNPKSYERIMKRIEE